jgi:hypothetical protein
LAICTEVASVDRGTEDEQLQEEEQPQEEDSELSGIEDSNDLPPPSRKRTRQATPTTVPEWASSEKEKETDAVVALRRQIARL